MNQGDALRWLVAGAAILETLGQAVEAAMDLSWRRFALWMSVGALLFIAVLVIETNKTTSKQ